MQDPALTAAEQARADELKRAAQRVAQEATEYAQVGLGNRRQRRAMDRFVATRERKARRANQT